MKKNILKVTLLAIVSLIMVACSSDANLSSKNVLSNAGEEFQLSGINAPHDWDVVGLVHVPFSDLMPRGDEDGYHRLEVYFGKASDNGILFNEPSYGILEYSSNYDVIYGILHAYANSYQQPLDSWEQALNRLLYFNPDEYESVDINGKTVYYHSENQDVYVWLSEDKTVEYYFFLEQTFSIEEMKEILPYIVN